jgi:hypothetical protein
MNQNPLVFREYGIMNLADKVHHIDQQVTNILGIIATYKIIVYGE